MELVCRRINLTEEQQGGTMPPAEASAEAPTSASPVGTVAVADEPATSPSLDTRAPGSDAPAMTSEPESDPAPVEAVAEASAPVGEAPAPEAAASEAAAPDAEIAAPEAMAPEAEIATPEAPIPAAEPETPAPAAEPALEPEAPAATAETAETPAESAAAPEPETAAPAPAPKPAAPTGPEPTTMEELLAEQDADIKSFKHGDVVEGSVVRIDKDEILVDIGAKSEGVVSNRELFGRNTESQPALNIGDTVLVYVLQPESPEGHVVLSLRRAGLERKWRSMQEQFEAGVIIEAPVIDHNKGGLIVDCGIRGFVPISQIVDFPRRPQNDQPRDAAQEIAEKLQPFVGRKLRLKILEVNRKANRLILSEKVALYEERREKRDELFSSLQVGQKVTGHVRSIAPFGVFVDLGGIDGLVHKSELSWNKVNNPEGGYRVGEEVEAEVIDINHERGRISLSIRRLQPDPWHSTVADFKVGDIIDGTVTKLVNFGAFVRVRDGLEGLIHISELSNARVAHPGDVVHEGQSLKLRIISLDSERHRLGLSLKQAEEAPARPVVEASPLVDGASAPRAERPERAERGDRRPRPDRERTRTYSASDAVQEPEGGIDTTLAAAFAGVREQLARAEAGDEGDEAPATDGSETASDASDEAPADVDAAAEAMAEVAAPSVEPEAAAAPEADAPEADTVAPEADTVAPEADTVAPEADTVAPEADTVAPEADTVAPEADTVAPEAEIAAPEAPSESEPATEPEATAEPDAVEAASDDEPAAVADALAEAGSQPASDEAVEPEPMASGELMAAAEPASEVADQAPPEDEQPTA
jgi:small subunit ribosomal protein S1